MRSRQPGFEHLRRVPILENTVCVGLDASDPDHHYLVFLSLAPYLPQAAREVQVYVSGRNGGALTYSYKIWDDSTGTIMVREGPDGDPTSPRDKFIEEVHLDDD